MASSQSDKQREQHQVIDLSRSRPRANRPARTDERKAARQAYSTSVAAGQPLSGRELANRYGYSRSWGRDRINEVRAETSLASDMAPALADAAKASNIRNDANADGSRERSKSRPESGNETSVQSNHYQRRQVYQGRRVAWLAFIVGIAASVAANVMHAQTVSTSPAAWIGAAFWPVALLLTIEVLARVPWPAGSPWARLARLAGAALVATVAAVLSYRHMAGLLASWGEEPFTAYLGPLAVDGLMILAAAALLVDGARNRVSHHPGP